MRLIQAPHLLRADHTGGVSQRMPKGDTQIHEPVGDRIFERARSGFHKHALQIDLRDAAYIWSLDGSSPDVSFGWGFVEVQEVGSPSI